FTVSSPNLALAVPNEPMWFGCASIAGDSEAQAWYEQTGMPVFAWSAQARGFFSGRFNPELTEGATTDARNVIRTYYSADNWERYRRADELAELRAARRGRTPLPGGFNWPLTGSALIGPRPVHGLTACWGPYMSQLS